MTNAVDILTRETSEHFLYPSTIFVSKDEVNVQTLLGSCVAVCLYDTRLRIGGINHYMMPMWNDSGLASPKFGNIAIDDLVMKMLAKGSKKVDLIAKIFGGACQYEYENRFFAIGEKNIQVAESSLANHHINIVARSVGGDKGRKIIFNTFTGQVMMKLIEKQKICPPEK